MGMSMQEIIEQMESLAQHCDNMIDKGEPDSIWKNDAEALRVAVDMLEKEMICSDPIEAIKGILREENITQQELAGRIGTLRQNVSQTLNRGSGDGIRYGSFSKMVKALGYEVVLRKMDKKLEK